MKKYLFLALAAFAFVACADNDMDDINNPAHSGEVEESYIAINLSASDITRAGEGFEDGTEAESRVNHADFFFFDGQGNAFPVTVNTDGTTSSPGGGVNHLRAVNIAFSADANNGDDISHSSNAVLLLKTYQGEYPSQIVAVLNWSPDAMTSYSLAELHQAVNLLGEYNSENYFVMSNAVYAQGTNAVYATPLTIENIKTSETDAMNAPVNIYVERVAAKVSVKSNPAKLEDGKFDLKENVSYVLSSGVSQDGKAYAKILGWDLYRDNSQSKLLKEINGAWTDAVIGFGWNDAPWYRSYWAVSLDAPTNDEIKFDLDDTAGFNPGFADGAHTYIGENTTGKATCTKVIVKAQLVNENDEPLELAIWNNAQYVAEADYTGNHPLNIAVANTLKYTYFSKTDGGYEGLRPEDLICVAGGSANAPSGVKANEVYFQLSLAGEEKEWYKLVGGEYQPVANDLANDPESVTATNEALKKVPSAILYEEGKTFYYVDIKHLGAPSSAAEYGIVRNHIYNITINSISGYGSPIYVGNSHLEYPPVVEYSTYVSAKINILSWKVVNQSVDITPNN